MEYKVLKEEADEKWQENEVLMEKLIDVMYENE